MVTVLPNNRIQIDASFVHIVVFPTSYDMDKWIFHGGYLVDIEKYAGSLGLPKSGTYTYAQKSYREHTILPYMSNIITHQLAILSRVLPVGRGQSWI